ncbi:rod shape-determining protein [Candidatus Nesciobacter abundans]|nr:rod shape-determining protein [Candidatus Nesciobacter abundans]
MSKSLAIDLGTANTLILTHDGKLINEPSVVAIQENNGSKKVLCVGSEAKKMLGRTPENTYAIRPMRDGVISDFIIAEEMIKHFMRLANSDKGLINPKVIIGVPAGATIVERRAIQDAAKSAGARYVQLVKEPMAAAIGAGLPVSDPMGSMVVDIGGGTTEIAILSLGGIVIAESCRVGGDRMDSAIAEYVKNEFQISIGESTAELIKTRIGAATLPPGAEDKSFIINGFDRVSGAPKRIEIKSSDVVKSIETPLIEICSRIKAVLDQAPPELASDIAESGICLSGGGALIKNIDVFFNSRLGLKFFPADDALMCVVKGAAKILYEMDDLKLESEQ